MDPSTPVFKSRLRKRFYREYDLHLGDPISSYACAGRFYGLSARGTERLTVLYRPATSIGGKVKELPQTVKESGIEVKVMYEPV